MRNEIARFVEIHQQIADLYYEKGQKHVWSIISSKENINKIIKLINENKNDKELDHKIWQLLNYLVYGE